jgi:hypothetical protein
MADNRQWEYRVASAGSFWTMPKEEEIEAILNDLGAEGWEVVSLLSQYGSNKVRIVAKRPVDAAARRPRTWPG